LGERFTQHRGVIGFQIDNELGMFGARCYCPVCMSKFRQWLESKYGNIEALNERLGMRFGSNQFLSFADVPLPRLRQEMHSPGLLLDSQRFFSDSNIAYVCAQAQALRQAGARQPITTNVCHMLHNSPDGGHIVDGHKLFADLDVAGFDGYPSQFAADPPPSTMGLLHAIARGYKQRRYWMMEQQAGSPMGMAADDPRRIRLWTWQTVAHGGELILYWHWRSHRFGDEQYWRGILDHDGKPNRRYTVVAATGAEIARHAALLDRLERANDVAILFDYDSAQSLALKPPGSQLSYRGHAEQFFAALQACSLSADAIFSADQLSRYRVVIAPLLRLIDVALAEQLRTYVHDGGTLIVSMLTATLTRDHGAPEETPPYLLKDVLGIERVEWGSLSGLAHMPKELLGTDISPWGTLNTSRNAAIEAVPGSGLATNSTYPAQVWYDELRLNGAWALAYFGQSSPAPGTPAITLNGYGKGQAIYVATASDLQCYTDLLRNVVGLAGTQMQPVDAAALVEIVPCRDGKRPVYFVLNHSTRPCQVRLDGGFTNVISETFVSGVLELAGFGVALLVQQG
jgi:beta-galactosidase